MATSASYGNWGQFWTLAKLDFVIHGTPDNQTTKIYANARNMVEAIVTVELLDSNGKKLNVTDAELKKELYFCHFETGEKLDSSWLILDDPNEYLIGTSKHTEERSDTGTIRYVSKYIACSKHELAEITEKISVGINIPGVGKFDTSRNGTSTKGKSGGVFKSPKSFEITASRPIDYGIHANIQIECGEFETIESGLKWVSRLTTEGPLKEHWDGQCKRRIVYIRPNKNVTGQDKFKTHEIVYDPIKNADATNGTIWWWWGTDKTEPGFSLIKNGYASPGAVIGRGVNRDDYQLNLWFSRKNHVGIDGKFYVVDSNYYYRFNDNGHVIEKNHFGEDENGAATLVLYKLVLPVYNTYQWKWHDVIKNITVKVTDFYGNEGSFQLLFNDTDKFDEPSLK